MTGPLTHEALGAAEEDVDEDDVDWPDVVAELLDVCIPIELDEELREVEDVVVVVDTTLPPPGT